MILTTFFQGIPAAASERIPVTDPKTTTKPIAAASEGIPATDPKTTTKSSQGPRPSSAAGSSQKFFGELPSSGDESVSILAVENCQIEPDLDSGKQSIRVFRQRQITTSIAFSDAYLVLNLEEESDLDLDLSPAKKTKEAPAAYRERILDDAATRRRGEKASGTSDDNGSYTRTPTSEENGRTACEKSISNSYVIRFLV